jgi:hypothetical protein
MPLEFVSRPFSRRIVERNLPSLGGVASAGGDGGNDASADGDNGVGSRAGRLAAGVGSRGGRVGTSGGGRLASGTGGVRDCDGDGC